MSYMSSVAGKSIIYKGDADDHEYVWGKFASASATIGCAYPGRCFEADQSNADTFIATSAATVTRNAVWCEFIPRTSSTFGEVDIDTVYTATEEAKFLAPGRMTVWWAAVQDLGGDYYGGTKLTYGTSGNLTLLVDTSHIAAIIDWGYKYTDNDRFCRVRLP